MRIALQATGGSYATILEWARYAESRDLDAFAIPDHYLMGPEGDPHPTLDALAVMAGLARDTRAIPLVLLVSPITWRHPAVLAKTAATLQDMSDNRLTLGVGTGWMEEEHAVFGLPFPELSVRFDMLEEALGYLSAVFAEPPTDFAGEHYRFTAFDVTPRPPLRLLVGGTGMARTPRLAGAYADEFNAYPMPYKAFEAKVDRARQAASAAGRDPSVMALSTTAYLAAATTVAGFNESLERTAAVIGRKPEELEEGLRIRNAPHGTWDQVRETLDGFEDRGVTRLYVQTFADDLATIDEKLSHLL